MAKRTKKIAERKISTALDNPNHPDHTLAITAQRIAEQHRAATIDPAPAKPEIAAPKIIGGITIDGISYPHFRAWNEAKALDAEFNAPAPYLLAPGKAKRATVNSGTRGKARSGKRATIKRALLSAMLDFDLVDMAAEHGSTVASVRAMKSDLMATMSAVRGDLKPEFAATVKPARDNWLSEFNAFLFEFPACTLEEANAQLANAGFDHIANGADLSASNESLMILGEHAAFADIVEDATATILQFAGIAA